MTQRRFIGAVEIGTSKVVALVGQLIGERSLNIIGLGQSTALGVKKGEITDFRSVSNSTHAAISTAEKSAGVPIEGVYLSQSGFHLEGFSNRGSVTVSSSSNVVRAEDIRRGVEEAKRKALPPGRVFIHHVQSGFLLDGREVEKPIGMRGDQIEVCYWHLHGDEKKISDHLHVINGYGVPVQDMIVSSIASGSMIATESEKQHGVLVLDVGCGTTDYVLYRGGRILKTGVVGIGGDHFTNDLSLGLRISAKQAEKLKLDFGKAEIDDSDKGDYVWLIGDLTIGDRPIPKLAIYKILNARAVELFSILLKEFGPLLTSDQVPAGVILTGGGSRMEGLISVATGILGIAVRAGENPLWVREDLRKPEYSTVLGLLHYGLTAQQTETEENPSDGLMKKVARIFNLV